MKKRKSTKTKVSSMHCPWCVGMMRKAKDRGKKQKRKTADYTLVYEVL